MTWLTALRASPISTLIVVSVAVFTDALVYGMVVPIFVPEVLGVSTLQLGILFAGYAGGLLLFTPILGILSDKFGRKWPMLAGFVGLSGATLMLAFIKYYPAMVMARFLQGASAAATWVAGLALLADTYPSHELGSAMGLVMTAMSLGMLLGPPFGGFVYQLGGYQLPFIIASGIAILDAVVRVLLITERTVPAHSMPVLGEEEGDEPTPDTYLLHQPYKVLGYSSGDDRVYTDEDLEKLREHLPAPARRPPTFFAIMFNRNVLVTNVIVALGANAITVLEPTLPAVLDEKFNSSAAVIGLAFMVMALAHGLSAPVFGWLSDKIGGPVLMLIGLSSLSIALTLVSPPNSLWLTLLALVAVGVTSACTLTPTLSEMAATVDEMGGGAYGQVYAIFNWFYALGMLGGPLIGGALVDWLSFRAMLLVFAASCACFVPVAGAHWWALRRR